jgi:hypothetical protein
MPQRPGGTERSFALEELDYRLWGDFADISITIARQNLRSRTSADSKRTPSDRCLAR